MKKTEVILSVIAFASAALLAAPAGAQPTMKDHFKDQFLIGAAIPVRQLDGHDHIADSVTRMHYNSIVAEDCMKNEKIHPEKDKYYWHDADMFIDYGVKNNMAIIGHCLVWHSQLAPWFMYDDNGNLISADELKERMREHITTVMTRYKGKIHGWDVVNEAIEDDGSYRKSPFYQILGEEFIPFAFEVAHAADPDAELYLNDFSMASPKKRATYLRIIKELKDRGLRIDGIGLQSHMGMDYPNLKQYEKSIRAFGDAGMKVMITELDLSALPTVRQGANVGDRFRLREKFNPYRHGLTENVSKKWNDRMADLFDIYKRNSDVITRITFWGTHDGMSWRNNWPMFGRTDYPLPFDRKGNLKSFMAEEISK